SPDGAALRDILKIINRRFANLIIDILPVHVQGADASAEIIAGLEAVNALPDIDVVIVTRGGGSLEDLWAFNDEGVARAIAACRFPVISAVGHETDFTLADFVADLRAPTPSAAAEMVVEKKEAFIETISSFGHRLAQSLRLCLREWKNRFELTQAGLRDPRRGLEDLRLRTDDFTERLHSVALQRLQNKRELRSRLIEKLLYVSPLTTIQQLQHNVENQKQTILLHMRWKLERCLQAMEKVVAQLDSSSPLAILKRGYSITRTWPEKEVIRDVRSIQPAQVLHIKLYRGTILCRVEETKEDDDSIQDSKFKIQD
ncbi:MAG TPA: exodeoxyribonuclease VII large subunit, partial [Thermodesulfobacteriota bacterium]|nr:exodeoxyribonuclease VII large subunit [Thermodesulfobacteriota bacterium]